MKVVYGLIFALIAILAITIMDVIMHVKRDDKIIKNVIHDTAMVVVGAGLALILMAH